MATILFTSSADSGPGTLRQAILDCSDGDTIMPDPSVFGSEVTIQLASALTLTSAKSIYISGHRVKIILDVQELSRHFSVSSTSASAEFYNVTFINGKTSSNGVSVNSTASSVRFYYCQWHNNNGSDGQYTCLVYVFGNDVKTYEFDTCLFSGNYCGRGLFYASPANTAFVFRGCTFASNNRDITLATQAQVAYQNTVVSSYTNPSSSPYVPPLVVLPSNAGYVTAGPNSPSAGEIAEWDEWNMHLTSGSSLKTGATYEVGAVDLDGVERHQGQGAGSYGCYEYVTQDALIRIFGTADWAQIGLYDVDVPLQYNEIKKYF